VFDCAFYYTDVSIIPLASQTDADREAIQPTTTTAATTTTALPGPAPSTSAPAAPVPAPAPTQQPTGLGTDAAMDVLATTCFNGTMQACDDLYSRSPAGSAYETFGDTCAGRQPAATGRHCTDVFTDTG
jgi:hypothetical protein